MWSCPFCGSQTGTKFKDNNLQGMLCMHPNCGRFDQMDENRLNQFNPIDTEAESLA